MLLTKTAIQCMSRSPFVCLRGLLRSLGCCMWNYDCWAGSWTRTCSPGAWRIEAVRAHFPLFRQRCSDPMGAGVEEGGCARSLWYPRAFRVSMLTVPQTCGQGGSGRTSTPPAVLAPVVDGSELTVSDIYIRSALASCMGSISLEDARVA